MINQCLQKQLLWVRSVNNTQKQYNVYSNVLQLLTLYNVLIKILYLNRYPLLQSTYGLNCIIIFVVCYKKLEFILNPMSTLSHNTVMVEYLNYNINTYTGFRRTVQLFYLSKKVNK